ncbi:MAG: FUSC family protein [Verrucomicrobiota bacterium]
MTAAATVPASRWEHRLFEFFRQELAPSPTRWRATLRITLLCALGTVAVMTLHIPNGEFLIIFFFAVSQPDAWASFRRARLRGIGTIIGGALSILTIILCGDKPWLFFPLQALIFATGLFLSLATTIPYAVLIALFTFVVATPLEQADPEGSLKTALWRILLTWIGVVFGTIGQLVLWPEKPEKLLLRELVTHLRRGEEMLECLLTQRTVPAMSSAPLPANVSAAVVAGQLDLLASAEAGAPQLRQYHAQQIELITDIELIFGLIVRLEHLVNSQPSLLSEPIRVRIQKIQDEIVRLRHELKQGNPPPVPMICEPADSPADAALENKSPTVAAVVQKLERCLRQMPASMAFLKMQKDEKKGLDRVQEPIAPGSLFSPAFSLSNIAAVQFSLKGTLAASICYVIYQSLNWPGISTCVVTAVIAMQSSFGASIQKGLLRLAGAALGAALSFGIITLVMPNMQTVASVVVVTAVPFFIAGWIVSGSTRISYVGIPTGLVLALVLMNRLGPTTNLAPAGDRILGVFIGLVVMSFINLTLWPNFAGKALRKKLADAMRALANISRTLGELARSKFDLVTGQSHREITAALALYDESTHEFGLPQAATEANRHQSLAVISRLQEIFLALLAVSRQRTALEPFTAPVIWPQRLQTLDEAIAKRLEMLADSELNPTATTLGSLPDLNQSLADFKSTFNEPAMLPETEARVLRRLLDLAPLYGDLVEALENLQTDLKMRA